MRDGSHNMFYGYQNNAYPYYYEQVEQIPELKKMIQHIFVQLEKMEERMDQLEEKVNQAKNIDLSSILK